MLHASLRLRRGMRQEGKGKREQEDEKSKSLVTKGNFQRFVERLKEYRVANGMSFFSIPNPNPHPNPSRS